jgi:DNA-binding MarR family transcriptional regulator
MERKGRRPREGDGSDVPLDCESSGPNKRSQSKRERIYFAPLPMRAIGDAQLSALDVRVLACLAVHDRMSGVTGKGQGAWASNEKLAGMIGCHYTRLSSSITRLARLGYLEREQHPLNKRLRVYRVLYNSGWDTLPNVKESGSHTVCQKASQEVEDFAGPSEISSSEQRDSCANIFRGNEERYFAEAREKHSIEMARSPVRHPVKIEFSDNVGAQLAAFERSLKTGEIEDCIAWYGWLFSLVDRTKDDRLRAWAARLTEDLGEQMTGEEIEAAMMLDFSGQY